MPPLMDEPGKPFGKQHRPDAPQHQRSRFSKRGNHRRARRSAEQAEQEQSAAMPSALFQMFSKGFPHGKWGRDLMTLPLLHWMEERARERRYLVSLARTTHRWLLWLLNQLLRPWRDEPMILFLPHHFHAARPTMQRFPNVQQYAFPVLPPLMIPESQFFDAFRCEQLCSFLVALKMLRQAVLKTVQFHGQPCSRAVEVQKVFPLRMLAAELETREAARLQRAPQFLFLIRLVTTETAGDGGGIHASQLFAADVCWQ